MPPFLVVVYTSTGDGARNPSGIACVRMQICDGVVGYVECASGEDGSRKIMAKVGVCSKKGLQTIAAMLIYFGKPKGKLA